MQNALSEVRVRNATYEERLGRAERATTSTDYPDAPFGGGTMSSDSSSTEFHFSETVALRAQLTQWREDAEAAQRRARELDIKCVELRSQVDTVERERDANNAELRRRQNENTRLKEELNEAQRQLVNVREQQRLVIGVNERPTSGTKVENSRIIKFFCRNNQQRS